MSPKHRLDRIDHGILAALQNDGRLSNKELAAKVGLAPSSCLERVRRLRARGLIRGVHADVDPEALGVGLQALVFVDLGLHTRDVYERFRAEVGALPEVVALFQVAGRHDFVLHVAVRDPQHLQDLGLDQITSRPEVVHIETSLIFEHQRSAVLPDWGGA